MPWIPCHGIITGYEGDDYLYSACGQQGRSSWTTLGNCDVKVVEVRRIMRCEPAPLLKTVYDSLNFALRMAEEPSDIVNPGYRTGSAAFALWADSLEAGTAERESQSFNAKCWLECRTEAVSFLNEAKVALPGMADSAFDATSHYYSAVCAALTAHLVLFPPSDGAADWNARLQSHESAILLREAAEAEACAISALHDIVTSISVL